MFKNTVYVGLIFLMLFHLASCKSEKGNEFSLYGKIIGVQNSLIALEKLGFSKSELIDSVRTDENGNFKIVGFYKEPELYSLKIDDKVIMIIIDNNDIEITTDIEKVNEFTVKGSPSTQTLKSYVQRHTEKFKDLMALSQIKDSLITNNAVDSLISQVDDLAYKQIESTKTFIKNFSDTTTSLPVAIFTASNLLAYPEEIYYLENFSSNLSQRFAPTEMSISFSEIVKERVLEDQVMNKGPKIGSIAPDFTLPKADGSQMKLSDFKGKYVLLDFWASWCPPCRKENPNLVEAYHKFSDKNFTVFGVSIDENKDDWNKAIEDDQLTWDHVVDIRGWKSQAAALYNVQSIPANYLIDPDGKIIAINLRGSELQRELRNIFED